MTVPLYRKSLFFELDNEILAPVLLFETLNIILFIITSFLKQHESQSFMYLTQKQRFAL